VFVLAETLVAVPSFTVYFTEGLVDVVITKPVMVMPPSGVSVIEPPSPLELKYKRNSELLGLYAGSEDDEFFAEENDTISLTVPDVVVKLV